MINRPAEVVFDAITKIDKHPEWSDGVKRVYELSEGPVRVGTKWKQTTPFVGQDLECEAEVTRFESNRLFAAKVTKPLPAEMTWELKSTGPGTLLTLTGDFEPNKLLDIPAKLKVTENLIPGQIKREWDRDLSKLKTQLES